MSKSVLFVSTIFPEPNSSAAGKRILQLIQLFLENNYLVHFASTSSSSEFSFDLTEFGVESYVIQANNSSFDQLLTKIQADYVVFDRFYVEEQFSWKVDEILPTAIKILDTEDLHFLRKFRQESLKSNELNIWESNETYREIGAIYRSDLAIIISEFEYKLLINKFPDLRERLIYIPIFAENATILLPTFEERANFIFIGNFFHEPNVDAVVQLKKSIWPKIRKKLPNTELHIYGAYLPKKIENLHQIKDGFLIKGRAEDALKVVRNAKILLAPLRFGAGLKGKLLEAMVCGTPSITTTIGAEGISNKTNWPGFVEDDFEAFAEKSILLYENKLEWKAKQKKSDVLLLEKFSKNGYSKKFQLKLEYLSNNLNEVRETNFIGKMLGFHLLKSSKYLSKWIEEKSKR